MLSNIERMADNKTKLIYQKTDTSARPKIKSG